ncbi:proton-conducting membrane transporter [Jatrophihabitans telluris]|uniref:Proton-conducting membrane transporter n=1 Tax=Jatrophihabitans telluris TaxID=2038343 RepID=A0ABY4QW68_9ACTN|nr:NADH-ubiquinone oxidoreductase-F iron-sulfur binding region domain-containing protein [Jatrophihabitans telluris]UQX87382.1 proton-conducting membrane transporter [Jatrophihabitans telluris]
MSARLQLVEAPDGPEDVLIDGLAVFGPHSDDLVRAPGAQDLAAHGAQLGPRPSATGLAGDELLDAVNGHELAGRGGAAFPVARKWQDFLRAGLGGMVVANGAESEPLSAKDAALLQLRPHLVLDGLASAAEAVGAEETVVWLHESATSSRQAVTRALAERRAHLPSEPAVRIELAAEHYLSGESSVIVNSLSGRRALPSFRRVPATTAGVHGRPTLVHNVETLACIGLLARGQQPDRYLVTVAHGQRRTVVELTPTDRLSRALSRAGVSVRPQAVLLGGYGGTWWSGDRFETLGGTPTGTSTPFGVPRPVLGAGVMLALDERRCGLRYTATIVRYLAQASARQCGPCLFGLPAVADLMQVLADGRPRRRDLPKLERFLAEIDGRGACHHPDGAVRLIRSALQVFAPDVRRHLQSQGCLHD